MIFVTLGTTKFPFVRLLKNLDSILIKLKSKEKIIIQDKTNCYHFQYQNTQKFTEIPFPKLIKYFSTARIVITHGGLASIFLSQRYSKNQPIIIPRCQKYKEHVNNHQIIFTNSLLKQERFQIFSDKNLKKKLHNYIQKPIKQKHNSIIACSPKLISKLNNFCQEITHEK